MPSASCYGKFCVRCESYHFTHFFALHSPQGPSGARVLGSIKPAKPLLFTLLAVCIRRVFDLLTACFVTNLQEIDRSGDCS